MEDPAGAKEVAGRHRLGDAHLLRPGARADVVVVDRLSQCAKFGELSHAIAAGLMREGDVRGQLGEVVAGRKPGRSRDDEITICDLTGVGFQDTAIAALAWAGTRGQM